MFRATSTPPRASLAGVGLRAALVASAGLMLGGCLGSSASAVRDYPVDYRQRHPIMVSPQGAYVATQCGTWPHDLGPAHGVMDMANLPNWNHGCATQANLATMVDNPNDLLGPRPEGMADASRRQAMLVKYRRGDGPGPHTPHDNLVPLSRVRNDVK
ncbi:MAG: CpaD family pilus assembly lipoprotein [Alphaproteobacteria bacterium]|jgi:pilus assembly protein CpaD